MLLYDKDNYDLNDDDGENEEEKIEQEKFLNDCI